MATITTAGSGNWSSTTPNAPWPDGTKPTTGDVVEIAAGHTVTLDEDTAVLGAAGIKNVAGSNTSVLDINGTRTINGCVSYSGTATTGFITVGTGDALTINYTGGAGTNAINNTAGGYCVFVTGSGALTVSNSGGTAVRNEEGLGISSNSTGTITITGDVTETSYGTAVYQYTNAGNVSITGNISATSSGPAVTVLYGVLTVVGKITGARAAGQISGHLGFTGTTFTWTGTYTYTDGEMCSIRLAGTTHNLGTIGTALAITNTDAWIFFRCEAAVTTTYLTITHTSANSQTVLWGQDFTITQQNLTAGNVKDGVTILGVTGTLAGGATTYFVI